MDLETLGFVGAAAVLLTVTGIVIASRSRRRERRDQVRFAAAREQGLHIPASLHPVFDPDLCIGSLACIAVCPEGDVLGIVNGVGTLIVGANCIGHGRCAAECPAHAIRLVFGTAERGVDIPRVSAHFESTVPGIYVVGELGGMGLVRNAIRQGVAAVRHLAEHPAPGTGGESDDLVIVGAGPAGFAAALAAQEVGLRYRVIDQDSFGGTVAHYPRQKLVLTDVLELPLAGRIGEGEVSKEDLVGRWREIRERFGLHIQEREKLENVEGTDGRFRVVTDRGSYAARKVVLALGRRGTPRRLGVPGEELPSVTYRLIDPEQYTGRPVLVVGGGDSAVEAACSLAEAGALVALSYRGAGFDRCKPANRERIARLAGAEKVRLHFHTMPERIEPSAVILARAPGAAGGAEAQGEDRLPADYVVVCAGGELPSALLARFGIAVDRHYGEPL
jgi:thioredoxin reductase/ferredoxin